MIYYFVCIVGSAGIANFFPFVYFCLCVNEHAFHVYFCLCCTFLHMYVRVHLFVSMLYYERFSRCHKFMLSVNNYFCYNNLNFSKILVFHIQIILCEKFLFDVFLIYTQQIILYIKILYVLGIKLNQIKFLVEKILKNSKPPKHFNNSKNKIS